MPRHGPPLRRRALRATVGLDEAHRDRVLDHIAGLHAFPRARLYCARAGLAERTEAANYDEVLANPALNVLVWDIPQEDRDAIFERIRFSTSLEDLANAELVIEAVPENSPMGRLRGTDNQVAIYTKRYKTNPLVVTGPGAGAEVTAAGVRTDIVAITMEERRRKSR